MEAVQAADPFTLVDALRHLSIADVDCLRETDAEALVVACQRIVAAVQARQSVAMDVLARRVDERLEEERRELERRSGRAAMWIPDAGHELPSRLAPALRTSARSVERRLRLDRTLASSLETTLRAAWDGDLERQRTDAVVEAGSALPMSLHEQFEALVLESCVDEVTGEQVWVSRRVRDMCRSNLARRARQVADRLAPEVADARAEQARDSRRVVVQPAPEPGMAQWEAVLPSETSLRMHAAVDALASRFARGRPGVPVDACRADALAALVLGSATITTTIELLIPVLPARTADRSRQEAATCAAEADWTSNGLTWIVPGMVDHPQHGVLLPEVVTRLLSDPAVVIRLARLDPDGSIVQDPHTYRPSASMLRRIRSRDGTCRFPGCNTPARRTDADHVLEFPVGLTTPDNLVCLCRTHHLFKHHSGWRPLLAPDGTVAWSTPDGRTYTTAPRPHALMEGLSLTGGLDPAMGREWLPGLPPGMSLADLAVAEAAQPDSPPDDGAVPEPPPDWCDLDLPQQVDWALGSSPLECQFARQVALAA